MKNKQRKFHPKFAVDLKNATSYYDEISLRVGNDFRDEVQAKLDLIASTSEGFAIIYRDVRPVRLRKFPYVLLYRSYNDHVQYVGLVFGSTERINWFNIPD